jgi:hypothetical protein
MSPPFVVAPGPVFDENCFQISTSARECYQGNQHSQVTSQASGTRRILFSILVRVEPQSMYESGPVASKTIMLAGEIQVRYRTHMVKPEGIPSILRSRGTRHVSQSDIALCDNELVPRIAVKHCYSSEKREIGVS